MRLFQRLLVAIFCNICITFIATSQSSLPQHTMLKMDDGNWSAEVCLYSPSGEKSGCYNWHEDNFMLGDLWSIGTLYGDVNGQAYKGYATLGYDPKKQLYVGTWVDNLSPEILHMEGTYDEKSKTLILLYDVTTSTGAVEARKNIMVYKSKNHRDYQMFKKNGTAWQKVMTIDYRRK